MIPITIPGFGEFALTWMVVDYNGTLATDGRLLPGVGEALRKISGQLEIHVVTADTFGLATKELNDLPVKLVIIPTESQAEAKLTYISALGSNHVVAIGNGRNDRLMLDAAAVGIAVLPMEGCSTEAISAADLVSVNLLDALELLRNPQRLVATLRS